MLARGVAAYRAAEDSAEQAVETVALIAGEVGIDVTEDVLGGVEVIAEIIVGAEEGCGRGEGGGEEREEDLGGEGKRAGDVGDVVCPDYDGAGSGSQRTGGGNQCVSIFQLPDNVLEKIFDFLGGKSDCMYPSERRVEFPVRFLHSSTSLCAAVVSRDFAENPM